MGRKTESRKIGDLDVSITQFKPTHAYHVSALALKTLGPVLGNILPVLASGGVQALLTMDVGALGAALQGIDVDALDVLRNELLGRTIVLADRNGKRVQFDLSRGTNEIDDAFDDDGMVAMVAAMKFSIEVNFRGFTKGAVGLAGTAAAPAATPST